MNVQNHLFTTEATIIKKSARLYEISIAAGNDPSRLSAIRSLYLDGQGNALIPLMDAGDPPPRLEWLEQAGLAVPQTVVYANETGAGILATMLNLHTIYAECRLGGEARKDEFFIALSTSPLVLGWRSWHSPFTHPWRLAVIVEPELIAQWEMRAKANRTIVLDSDN